MKTMNSSGSQTTGDKRFADYFVICGLDYKSGLEPDQLSGDSLIATPLDRPYRWKVLAHYPENVPWNTFDESAVGMLCMPRGLLFCTQKHTRESTHHSFIITREDGSRTYGHAFTFYEEVIDDQICAAMQTLQAMHLTELSSSKVHPMHVLSDNVGSRSLPRSFKLCNRQAQSKNGGTGSLYDINKDILYVTKCICLITPLPTVVSCHKFLKNLYEVYLLGDRMPLPLESYVYNILYEVPLPPIGRSVKFDCVRQEFLCQRPGSIELPLFEYSFQEFFSIMGVENVVQLFTCVMMENQILICSDDYHKLILVAECVTVLLFPFVWQHVYVPILPSSLHHFLDAPVPYIMGLHTSAAEKTQFSVPGEADICFVNIDNREIEVPEDIPKLPFRNELISEITSSLEKYGVPLNNQKGVLDRNLNERGSRRRHHTRKHSWSFDSGDSGVSSTESSARSSYSSLASTHSQILLQSEAMQRITAIAKRTGVISSLDDLERPKRLEAEGNIRPTKKSNVVQTYLEDLKLNNVIREIFLNRFVHMFNSYEHFVIPPSQQDMEQFITMRETMQNFDKTTFLSDQPEPHLPFLSRFIESQMFATLIDKKIISHWSDPDPYLKIFDGRIRECMARTASYMYEPCSTFSNMEHFIEERLTKADVIAPSPKEIPNLPQRHIRKNQFPMLDVVALNREPVHNKSKKRINAQFRRKDRQSQQNEHLKLSSDQREKYMQEARNKLKHPKLSDISPAIIAQTNWRFVEALLKECTCRTKRMLVEKMGQEAVELGHGAVSITGLEENTLIAGLCDLLERVWRHGLQKKQGKSALWSHLLSFIEVEECKTTGKPIDPNFLTPVRTPMVTHSFGLPELILTIKTGAFSTLVNQISTFDLSSFALESESGTSRSRQENRDKKKARTPEMPALKPMTSSLIYDVKNVQAISDIKTDVGYARAWVRLALEKKLLSKHLKKLLSNQELLRSLYRRYAFVRCDDEKEQFLYHLLTLNAVDYYCFTNTFTNSIVPYRIIIFPSRKLSASTSANAWVSVAGTLGDSGNISVPKSLELVFQHKNLGILTTLRIGHDNTGILSKWMVEHVVVRNEITNHTYKFPCGRWLGKGVDDGSTERLLFAERVPVDVDNEVFMESCRTPPRCRSPSMPRRPKLSVPEIQQILGDAVNNIVKHYYKPEKERGSLTILLCGEMGLVYCLEQVFLYGFKHRSFFRQVYLWDFFVKVAVAFENILKEDMLANRGDVSPLEHIVVMKSYCSLVTKIDRASGSMGKDGKFQLFICFAVRDHLLHRMLLHIASTPVTADMYEDRSFLRDPNLVTFLVQIMESLAEFDIVLEASLTKGIE